jgi:cation diffusion facilitator family transporter
MRLRAIALSVIFSVSLLGLKLYSYRLTRSTAVLSDALESIINVVASGFAFVSLWMAAKPPDSDHPYGHGKIEYFSAGFEGAMIIGAAFGIFYTGIQRFRFPHPLGNLELGTLVLFAAAAINLLLGLYLVHVGRKTDSIALTADGKHVLTDVYTTGGVLAGLVLVHFTGWYRLDGLIACLVGLNILWTGGQLVAHSWARLLDTSDAQLLERIARVAATERRPDWVDIHQMRAWRSGSLVHIDLHLALPADLTLEKAHQEAKLLENKLIEEFNGNASVLVHMDPCETVKCPICGRPACRLRHSGQRVETLWNRDRMTRASSRLTHNGETF